MGTIKKHGWILAALFLSWNAYAEDNRSLPNKVIEGVSEGVGALAGAFAAGSVRPLQDSQPRWETIPARPVKECLAEQGGVINAAVMRCRNGRQEFVRIDGAGNRHVLSERPIPE